MADRSVVARTDFFNVYYISWTEAGIGYVGITGWSVHKRFERHLWNARRGRAGSLYDAMRALPAESFTVELLEQVTSWDQACERERHFIATLGTKTPNGFNLTDGGDGNFGYEYTDEVRRRMSESGKKKRLTEEHRARIGAAHKGRTISSEAKEKMRQTKLGKKASDETRAKMSAARKGKKRPGISAALMGRKPTAETIERIRAATKGKKRSEEGRANMKIAAKARAAKRIAEGNPPRPPSWAGKKHSEETKAKMTASNKARWERRKAAKANDLLSDK